MMGKKVEMQQGIVQGVSTADENLGMFMVPALGMLECWVPGFGPFLSVSKYFSISAVP
jgi:hypothetical protein